MAIIKIQYDTNDPLCSIVKNLRLQAKEEVFRDIEKMKGFETYHKDKWVCHIKDYLKIKKRHLLK